MLQRRLGERAAAAADLEKAGAVAQFPQDRRHRLRHAFGERRPQFRRGDEIAFGAEFARARAVVAQARRIQRQFHEAGKGDGSSAAADLAANKGG